MKACVHIRDYYLKILKISAARVVGELKSSCYGEVLSAGSASQSPYGMLSYC